MREAGEGNQTTGRSHAPLAVQYTRLAAIFADLVQTPGLTVSGSTRTRVMDGENGIGIKRLERQMPTRSCYAGASVDQAPTCRGCRQAMSEFSDSYYLWTTNVDEARRFAVSTRRFSAMIPGSVWTQFLFESVGCGVDPDIVAHNRGILLRYRFAEDHGCSVWVFDAAREVGRIEWQWESGPCDIAFDEHGEPQFDDLGQPILVYPRGFDADVLVERAIIDGATADQLRALCGGGGYPELAQRYAVAQALKLHHFAWTRSDILVRQGTDSLADLPHGAVLLNV